MKYITLILILSSLPLYASQVKAKKSVSFSDKDDTIIIVREKESNQETSECENKSTYEAKHQSSTQPKAEQPKILKRTQNDIDKTNQEEIKIAQEDLNLLASLEKIRKPYREVDYNPPYFCTISSKEIKKDPKENLSSAFIKAKAKLLAKDDVWLNNRKQVAHGFWRTAQQISFLRKIILTGQLPNNFQTSVKTSRFIRFFNDIVSEYQYAHEHFLSYPQWDPYDCRSLADANRECITLLDCLINPEKKKNVINDNALWAEIIRQDKEKKLHKLLKRNAKK